MLSLSCKGIWPPQSQVRSQECQQDSPALAQHQQLTWPWPSEMAESFLENSISSANL